jgi:hypothetical protein
MRLADASLVVSSDLNKGGTWTGAVEQLDKLKFVPVYVRSTGGSSAGLDGLRKKGALPWPNPQDVLAKLERLIGEIGDLNSKLILLVGPSRSGKTQLLRQLGAKLNIEPLNVGLELGRRLAATPNNKRGFSAGELLREIADKERTEDPLLLDNLELLFEPSLQINPLDLVRRLAHSKRVVAVWPGELRGDRLVYADMSHPEHRDYSRDGVVVLEI